MTRAVVAAQAVFTLGNVLTTGGFLYYFANALHPSAFLFSVLLITPEVSESVALFSRPIVRRLGSRKRTWLIGYTLARIVALGIPALAFAGAHVHERLAFLLLVASLALSQAFQSIAYTAYISWMSDLVPRESWGRFFALRRIANVAILVLVPAAAALLRRSWTDWRSDETVRAAYLAVFLGGNVLMSLAIIPLMRLPDRPTDWRDRALPSGWTAWMDTLHNRSVRLILVSSLWLAFAQGLTQSAFFTFQVRVLGLPLEAYLLLTALMYLLQIPGSWLGGNLSDRYGDRLPLILGLLLVSAAMAFWLLARPGAPHWLAGAYALWGLFGLVNVCQRNLLLRTAPPSDNTVPIAVLEHLAGLCAGAAGLLGGWALDVLLAKLESPLLPYTALFLVSWIGRASAPLWLLPVRDSQESSSIEQLSSDPRDT
ncbi:MAG: MFS transporter [Planctomycetaceae bacterium]|nr:MFS transporter [Planctomycetaceae bacterium]